MSTFSAPVYRAIVTYSDTTTGQIIVRIPALTGTNSTIELSKIGRSSANDYWVVPKVGEQIVVTADDANFTNAFWLQTDPFNPGSKEPTGFSNRLDSTIAFNATTRVFSISPVTRPFEVWVQGIKYEIGDTLTLDIPNTTGRYAIYFGIGGALYYKANAFFDLEFEAPVAYLYIRSGSPVKVVAFADERHGTTLDWATHEYLHRTRGAAYSSGFAISNYTTTGDGSASAHMQFDLAGGTFFDEDLQVDITHSSSPTDNTWQQILQGPARIPVYYRSGTTWDRYDPTVYPVAFASPSGYVVYDPTGSGPVAMDNNKYGIAWIVATNALNYPVISIMGQAQYANIGSASEAKWGTDVSLTNLPVYEFRPLYKVIFESRYSGSTVKAVIRQIDDLRVGVESIASGAGASLNQQTIQVLSASYAVLSSDAGDLLRFTNSTDVTVTVNGTTNLLEGQRVDLIRNGTGNVMVQASGAGVSLSGTPGLKLRAQYSAASIVCVATNTYILIGDLAA